MTLEENMREENMRKGQKVIYFHNLFVAIKNLCDLN